MKQDPFLFESEETENESPFENSFEFFANEDEDEFYEYENESGETEDEDEFRRGRARHVPVRRQSAVRPRPRNPRRPRPPQQPRPRYPIIHPFPHFSAGSLMTAEPFQPSSELVRLLQSLLNRILGLNLAVDGVMNVETRSAIRSFQNQPNAPSESPVGSSTEPAEGQTDAQKGTSQEEFNDFEFYETAPDYSAFEDEFGNREILERETAKQTKAFPYVRSFASSDADCADAFKRAKKTRQQALTIINSQIGQAIRMLRATADKLKRGNRSAQTKAIFKKIFRVTPEFVPDWLKQTATIKDRGDVVATRCRRVAEMLERGGIRYFFTISKKNCPDCSDPLPNKKQPFACSSWGDESVTPKNGRVVCLGATFWDSMGETPADTTNLLAVLMHEPFHIYYGKYVTAHNRKVNNKPVSVGKFGGINCITQFVFEINGQTKYPARIKTRCDNTQVRR